MRFLGLAPIFLFLLISCSNKEESGLATVHFSFQTSKDSSTKHGAVSNPSTASDLDCVMVFASHPDKGKTACYNSIQDEIASYSHVSPSIANGASGNFSMETGDNIKLQVVAFSKDDSFFAGCPNFNDLKNNDFNYLSAMYVVSTKYVNLIEGDNNVTFQDTFTPSNSIIIDDCPGNFNDVGGCAEVSSYGSIDYDYLSCNYSEFVNQTETLSLDDINGRVFVGLTSGGDYYKMEVTNNASSTMTIKYDVYGVPSGGLLFSSAVSSISSGGACLDIDQNNAIGSGSPGACSATDDMEFLTGYLLNDNSTQKDMVGFYYSRVISAENATPNGAASEIVLLTAPYLSGDDYFYYTTAGTSPNPAGTTCRLFKVALLDRYGNLTTANSTVNITVLGADNDASDNIEIHSDSTCTSLESGEFTTIAITSGNSVSAEYSAKYSGGTSITGHILVYDQAGNLYASLHPFDF
jgi:hypothetical protein